MSEVSDLPSCERVSVEGKAMVEAIGSVQMSKGEAEDVVLLQRKEDGL